MGQLDRTSLYAPHAAHHLGMEPSEWLRMLDLAHPNTLMPYELAEIEEYSLAHDESIEEKKGDWLGKQP
jgi:hypothetical protein